MIYREVQTTVWKMMLEKVSGCVLIAIWLLAMAAESDRTENPLRGLKNRYSYVGLDVTFTCLSPMRSCLGMNWYKHKEGTERETIFNGSTPTLYNTDKYTVRLVDSGCQLTVNNVELSDAGLIICEIVTSPRSFEDTAFLLVFKSTDIPLKRPRSLINVIGTNATFTCVSPLKNCVEMTWQRGLGRWGFPINYDNYPSFRGKYIVENSTLGCQLTVANVQFYDVAIYECRFMKSFIGTANLFAINEQEGYLVTETEEEYVSAGSDAYIFCESPLHDCTLMNWYKYEEYDEVPHVITIYNLENGIYLRDKYDVESRDGSCQLTIKDVAINDTSMYYCEIVISRRPYEGETILWVTE